jgi:hypothetical protein
MIKTKATKPLEILGNTSVGRPDLHISSCGILKTSTKQPPEALEEISIHRRKEDGRGLCENEASLMIFHEDSLFQTHEPSELSMAKGSRCSVKCTIYNDDRSCCCMHKSSEDVGNTKYRTLYVRTDNFCPVIYPMDTNLLLPLPSPLELDDASC